MAILHFIGYLGYLFGQEKIYVDVKNTDELISFLKNSKLKDILFDEQENLYEGILFMKNNEILNVPRHIKMINSSVNKNVNMLTLCEDDEITISLPTAGG